MSEKRLTDEGTFQVAILDEPRWFKMKEKDGNASRMELKIRGYINGGEHDSEYIDAAMMFVGTIIANGKHAGKTMFEIQSEKCLELGMSAPFSPSKVGEMVGSSCEFVCETEIYNNVERLKVKYINTNSRPEMSVDDAEKIWKDLQDSSTFSGTPATNDLTPEPVSGGDDLGLGDDDVPFF